jgi:tetratricopeptide (TPR) repeat protein
MTVGSSSKRIALVVNALSGDELKAGRADSARVFGVLVNQDLGACDPGRAQLVDDCPDRDTFNQRLLKTLRQWSSDDQLLFYFSGHGVERRGLYHLCFGADDSHPFPFKNLLTELESAGVTKAIIVLDSCQSGAALRKGEKSPELAPVMPAEVPKGLAIVTSCRANQLSYENYEQTQSVFTDLFCKGIETGLSNSPTPDGRVSVSALVDWINGALKSDPKLAGFSQTSSYNIDGAEQTVWIALNKSGSTAAQVAHALRDDERESARPPASFDKWLTPVTAFAPDVVKAFRDRLRPDVREVMLPDTLDDAAFLATANLMSSGRLYAAGVLLFSDHPESLVPEAYVQCFEFSGATRAAAQDQKEIYGPLMRQLEGAMAFIVSRIEKVEITEQGALEAKIEYQYPMACIREVLANALCHRDYLEGRRHTHVRVFSDRIEIASPGVWCARPITDGEVFELGALESESAARNERLAAALRRIRLVETGGTGIPNALSDCRERGARPPIALSRDGAVTVTIFPRSNWSKASFDRRGGPAPRPSHRFRVALSFAGEKRPFVERVATLLAQHFGEGAILYDKYHEAELARPDLDVYLPDLYAKESDLVVVVLTPTFARLPWKGLDWQGIRELIRRQDRPVMLTRFDRAEVPELDKIAGFVDLDERTPEQTASLILERLAINEGRPKDYYTEAEAMPLPSVATRRSTLNNLPRQRPFFGRERELEAIRASLDSDSRNWGVTITGPGGMGKTSLAVRAAYDALDSFARVVFLSIKQRELDDSGVQTLDGFSVPGFIEMLNELARELGRPEIVKALAEERVRLLLDALRGTSTLIVLDNVELLSRDDRNRVSGFVNRLPQGSKAIVTSRQRIGSGGELLMLDKLDEPAALAMLADLARNNPLLAKTTDAERLTLYRQTDGHPLLMRWIAGQLGRGSCRTFADAIGFLRSCPPDNNPLEFIFGDLVPGFSDEETRVLVALSYFKQPATVEHIAGITDLGAEHVETALHTLANRSLIVSDQEDRAYSPVPMVGEFVRRQRADVAAAVAKRLQDYVASLLVENGGNRYDQFPILDREWPTIAAALPLIVDGPNDQLQTVCDALGTFLEFTGRWDERLSFSQRAEAKAQAVGDHQSAGWRAYEVGQIHGLRGQADEVLACAGRALEHWNLAQAGARERAAALLLRGQGHESKGDYAAAIGVLAEATALLNDIDPEHPNLAFALNELGHAEQASGDRTSAEKSFERALAIARQSNLGAEEAWILTNLSRLALEQGKAQQAELMAREVLQIAEKLGHRELTALGSHLVAVAMLDHGSRAEAIPYARQAVDIYTQLASPALERAQETLRETES